MLNQYEINYHTRMISNYKPCFSSDNLSLTAEGGKNFFLYLKYFNLLKEPDLLIISPNIHFYYEENDFTSVRTLILLKKLNLIKDLSTFMYIISHILPDNVNFIGCFFDSKMYNENGYLSGLLTRFNNLLNFRIYHNMHKRDVSELLEKCGFKIVDMTEMHGLTFFYSQNVR